MSLTQGSLSDTGVPPAYTNLRSVEESMQLVPAHTLSCYLSTEDIISLSQTTQSLRRRWASISFNYCRVYYFWRDDPSLHFPYFTIILKPTVTPDQFHTMLLRILEDTLIFIEMKFCLYLLVTAKIMT